MPTWQFQLISMLNCILWLAACLSRSWLLLMKPCSACCCSVCQPLYKNRTSFSDSERPVEWAFGRVMKTLLRMPACLPHPTFLGVSCGSASSSGILLTRTLGGPSPWVAATHVGDLDWVESPDFSLVQSHHLVDEPANERFLSLPL